MDSTRKTLPVVATTLMGFWAGDLTAMSVRTDIEAGTDPSTLIDHIASAFADPLRLSTHRADLICGLVGACAVALWWLWRWTTRRNWRDREEYGSARWARPDEMAPYTDRDTTQNLQMTASEGLSIDTQATRRNLNVLVLGGTGSGKTSSHVLPNLRNASMNYAATDPKGELHAGTHEMLEAAGYEVSCLDLVDLTCRTTFNPLRYIAPVKADLSIMRLVTNIIDNTSAGEAERHAGEDFWTKAEKSLLTALVAYVYYAGDDGDDGAEPQMPRTLNSVVDLAGRLEASEEDETMTSDVDAMMQVALEMADEVEHDRDSWDDEAIRTARGLRFAVAQYRPFTQGAGETKKSIIISLGVRLAPLNVGEVRSILSDDNIGIDQIGEPGARPRAIFLALPDEDSTFNFIAAIFYQCLFDSVMRRARTMPGQTLASPLHCFLDEFANVGRIPRFERLISTMRSRGVSASIILQNLSQLKSMYPKDWETMTGNCDSILFLGGMEQTTTEWMSKLLGRATIDMRETSDSKGASGSHSVSYRRTGRELMLPDELAHMDNDECIYVLRGLHPFRSRKLRPGQRPAKPRSRLRHSKGWAPFAAGDIPEKQ